MSRGPLARTRLALATTVLAVVAGSSIVAPTLLGSLAPRAAASAAAGLSALATPSWQTNAEVRHMAYADGRIWLVGSFTEMRPPGYAHGHHQTPADYFAAVTATTGALDTSVAHQHSFTGGDVSAADEVYAVAASPNGKTIYVGGNFTTVDGYPRDRVAAFSASTGDLLPWTPPDIQGKVSTIATAGGTVYLGGTFTIDVDGSDATNLAALSASTGQALSNWLPQTDATVEAIAVTPDNTRVVAGGYFDEVDGQTSNQSTPFTPYNKAVILSGESAGYPGTLEPMPADSVVPPGTTKAPVNRCESDVKDIVISGDSAYLANEGTGSGCFDGTWAVSLKDGTLEWVNRCLGATQAVAVVGDYLYKGSHAHNCRETNTNGDPANFPQVSRGHARHLLSENLTNGFLGPWYPLMNAGPALGPRTMATDGTQLYVGGDFTSVDGRGQQGIARFQTTPNDPTPAPLKPTVTSDRPGRVEVTAKAPVDLDNPTLTMELFKVGSDRPIATRTVTSYFWKQPTVEWTRTGIQQDSSQAYEVRAVAPGEHPSPLSRSASVRVACATTAKVRAALRSVKAAEKKGGARQVDLRICVGTDVSARVQLRKHTRVVASESRRLRRGLKTVRLAVPRRTLGGRYEARVVFVRGSSRRVQDRVVRLAH